MLIAILTAAALTVGITVLPTAAPAASAAVTAHRITAADRYSGAVAVSRAAFPTPIPTGTVVLVSGVSFADEVAAGPVALAVGGPVLLTTPNALPTVVSNEITRLHPERIMLLGGTPAISAAVETAARARPGDGTGRWARSARDGCRRDPGGVPGRVQARVGTR